MVSSKCPGCGRLMPADATQCPACGTGIPLNPSSGLTTAVIPDPHQGGWWDRRPTWFLFALVFAAGSVLLGAVGFAVVILGGPAFDWVSGWEAPWAATAVTTTAAVNQLTVGECLDDEQLEAYLGGGDFEVASCSDPHDYEVYVSWEYAPGPYPGDDAVKSKLAEVCLGEFQAYVGRDYDSSALDFYRAWPGRDLWESGSRIGECLLFDVEGNELTGSAYGRGW